MVEATTLEICAVDPYNVETFSVEFTIPVLVVMVEIAIVDAMREDPVSVENCEGVYPGMKMEEA
jgi:hypothetical protein